MHNTLFATTQTEKTVMLMLLATLNLRNYAHRFYPTVTNETAKEQNPKA
jgi:hypothetical protein